LNDVGSTETVRFTWAVNDVNQAPVLADPGTQTTAEGDEVALPLLGSDPDGDGLFWSVQGLPSGLSMSDAGFISGRVGFDAAGDHEVDVTLSDGTLAVSIRFTWVITGSNAPPVLVSPGLQEHAEGQSVVVQLTASDADGEPLTFTASGLPAGLAIDGATGRIEGTLSYDAAGDHNVTAEVSDGEATDAVTFTWRVTNVNRAPQVTTPEDRTDPEGVVVSLDVSAVDPDRDTLVYTAQGLPVGIRIDRDSGSISGTVGYETSGTHEVFLHVFDGADTTIVSFTWHILNTNRAPALVNPGEQRSVEGTDVTLALTGSDPDGDGLTWAATGLPQDLTIDGDTGLVSGLMSLEAEGRYDVVISATDGDLSSSMEFGWEVIGTNQAPTVALPGDETADEGETITLLAEGADPDGDELQYTWDLDSDGEYDDATGAQLEYLVPDGPGEYLLAVRATDLIADAFAQVTITSLNVTPTISSIAVDPQAPLESSPAVLTASIFDPVDRLAVVWNYGDDVWDDTGVHAWADAGRYEVTLHVTDGQGGNAEETVFIDVLSVPPQAGALDGPAELLEGEVGIFDVSWTKVTSDSVTLDLVWGDGERAPEATIDAGPTEGRHSGTHAFGDDGDYSVVFTITDDDGDFAQASRSVTVTNVAPQIVSLPSRFAAVDAVYSYQVEATDPGDDELSLSLISGPDGMSADGFEVSWIPNDEQAIEGSFEVVIEVIDDDGGEVRQTWTIQVTGADEDADEDGVPDVIERLCGLDPTDPEDADLDPDQDGIPSGEECLNGTDPHTSNAPGAVTPVAPGDGARVGATPSLVVMNAVDPDGDELRYIFEVYADPGLAEFVVNGSLIGQEEMTSWVVGRDLAENERYYWRARATDGRGFGPWSATWGFLVDEVNEPPAVPTPLSPRGETDQARPTFRVDSVRDPEGDAVAYIFEVFEDEDLTVLLSSGESDQTNWTIETDLAEDTPHFWRVAAADDRGAQSDWSEVVTVQLNANNSLPTAPEILLPEDGGEVHSLPATLRFVAAQDADGDPLLYHVQVSPNADFANLTIEQRDLDVGDAETYDIEMADLGEDTEYFARVWASDHLSAGPETTVRFYVNAENTPPGTPILVSPIGGERIDREDVEGLVLAFTPTSDPDGEPVTHAVSVYLDAELTTVVNTVHSIMDSGDPVVVELALPEEDGEFWWTATATDERGLSGNPGGPETFVVISAVNEPPTAPTPISPIKETVDPERFRLVIVNATDPEGDALSYGFGVYSDDGLTAQVWTIEDVAEDSSGETFVEVTGVTAELGSALYWVAWATDAAGNVSPLTAPSEFVFGEAAGNNGANNGANNGTNNGGNNGNNGAVNNGANNGEAPPTVDATPDDGCGCHTPSAPARLPWMVVVAMVLAMVFRGCVKGWRLCPESPGRGAGE
jgi:hypothetical protein